ncbi:MAG TPA: hypothetical protein PKA13_08480 [Geminicoccaceae bacterium]|nr:hypothetical protein [Geminicoccus sp.]HMU49799.1 hypothetical protein [Geminicoccaceae bacterium]
MAGRSNFTDEEWSRVLQSVTLAGIAITAASPSGLWGLIKESFAAGSVLAHARTDAGTCALAKAVIDDLQTSEGRARARQGIEVRAGDEAETIQARAVAALGEVGALVDARAAADAPAFKAWLRGISQRVAEAAKEGGFLGFGGVQVDEAEQKALADISAALKLA